MHEKYLPIGSVVLLKGATKKLFITGFMVNTRQNVNKVYDYCGFMYPEGIINSEEIAMFNHDQIDTIYAIGYSDEEEKSYKNKLEEK